MARPLEDERTDRVELQEHTDTARVELQEHTDTARIEFDVEVTVDDLEELASSRRAPDPPQTSSARQARAPASNSRTLLSATSPAEAEPSTLEPQMVVQRFDDTRPPRVSIDSESMITAQRRVSELPPGDDEGPTDALDAVGSRVTLVDIKPDPPAPLPMLAKSQKTLLGLGGAAREPFQTERMFNGPTTDPDPEPSIGRRPMPPAPPRAPPKPPSSPSPGASAGPKASPPAPSASGAVLAVPAPSGKKDRIPLLVVLLVLLLVGAGAAASIAVVLTTGAEASSRQKPRTVSSGTDEPSRVATLTSSAPPAASPSPSAAAPPDDPSPTGAQVPFTPAPSPPAVSPSPPPATPSPVLPTSRPRRPQATPAPTTRAPSAPPAPAPPKPTFDPTGI